MKRWLRTSLPLNIGVCVLHISNPWATLFILGAWANVMVWPVVALVTAVKILA